MSGWRRIEVDGRAYVWRGSDVVIVREASFETLRGMPVHTVEKRSDCGARRTRPGRRVLTISGPELLGVSNDTWERGQWKRTLNIAITPAHVAAAIRRVRNATP